MTTGCRRLRRGNFDRSFPFVTFLWHSCSAIIFLSSQALPSDSLSQYFQKTALQVLNNQSVAESVLFLFLAFSLFPTYEEILVWSFCPRSSLKSTEKELSPQSRSAVAKAPALMGIFPEWFPKTSRRLHICKLEIRTCWKSEHALLKNICCARLF